MKPGGTIARPVIDGAACVHGLTPMARCADCIDACPHRALSLGLDGIEFDSSACRGCGACAGICPARAIRLDAPQPVREGDTLIAVCARHPATGGRAARGCIHGYGINDLAGWALAGIRRIACGTGDCDTCPDAPASRLGETAAHLAGLAAAHGRTAPEVAPASIAELRRWMLSADDGPVPARRALLAALTAPLRGDEAPRPALERLQETGGGRFAFVPVIDAQACTGCDTCLRLCPEGVLSTVADERGGIRYHCNPARCTGCLLCEDVCTDNAIEVEAMTAAPADVLLEQFTCRACGIGVHVPASGTLAADGLCPVCARTGHHRKLFQVLP
ncbi:4Fe-4S binding protein [Tropicimonas sp.]|uniref:4Fe-4S binding protein n=1 Tax=Tropicimonas sp. TaxID=2067044 RepID=UPI003A880BC1